jgi:hypothetical protein
VFWDGGDARREDVCIVLGIEFKIFGDGQRLENVGSLFIYLFRTFTFYVFSCLCLVVFIC